MDTSKLGMINLPEIKIQSGDLLTILIYSDNTEATEIFNQPQTGGASTANANNLSSLTGSGRGYLVDLSGDIYLHTLGRVHAAGMTKDTLAKAITTALLTYLKNPYVVVRFANPRLTVLGEVNKPGVIEFSDQKISILDAIGLAGDLTPFSRRDNILVVREEGGNRTQARVDLRTADAYHSPYFFLKQNDMVYVEPTRKKPTGNDQVFLRNIAIVTSVLSIVTLMITLIK